MNIATIKIKIYILFLEKINCHNLSIMTMPVCLKNKTKKYNNVVDIT
jgi:hypothetical protein